MSDPIQIQKALIEMEQRAGGGERVTLREARQTIARLYLSTLHMESIVKQALHD
ncbi:hypothetical protein [Tsuneonella sp. HG222]